MNAIKKLVGSKIFQNIFVENKSTEINIIRGGCLSCAIFVSSILMLFRLIDAKSAPHSIIYGVLKNMQTSGWDELKSGKMKEEDVVFAGENKEC